MAWVVSPLRALASIGQGSPQHGPLVSDSFGSPRPPNGRPKMLEVDSPLPSKLERHSPDRQNGSCSTSASLTETPKTVSTASGDVSSISSDILPCVNGEADPDSDEFCSIADSQDTGATFHSTAADVFPRPYFRGAPAQEVARSPSPCSSSSESTHSSGRRVGLTRQGRNEIDARRQLGDYAGCWASSSGSAPLVAHTEIVTSNFSMPHRAVSAPATVTDETLRISINSNVVDGVVGNRRSLQLKRRNVVPFKELQSDGSAAALVNAVQQQHLRPDASSQATEKDQDMFAAPLEEALPSERSSSSESTHSSGRRMGFNRRSLRERQPSSEQDAALQTHSQQQSPAEEGAEVQLEVCVATLQLQADEMESSCGCDRQGNIASCPSEFSFDTAREEPCQLGTVPAGLSGTAPSVLSAHALPSLAPPTAQVTPCSEEYEEVENMLYASASMLADRQLSRVTEFTLRQSTELQSNRFDHAQSPACCCRRRRRKPAVLSESKASDVEGTHEACYNPEDEDWV